MHVKVTQNFMLQEPPPGLSRRGYDIGHVLDLTPDVVELLKDDGLVEDYDPPGVRPPKKAKKTKVAPKKK